MAIPVLGRCADTRPQVCWDGIPATSCFGRLGDVHYWASHLDDDSEPDLPDDHHLSDLRSLHGRLSDEEWNIAGRATQLVDWARDHRFCGRCGLETELASGMRAMRCPECGLTSFPRLSPAVIVLIERDDGRCLLGRNGLWDIPMYSTLAGFVEPGETLEDTVHREVFEEVGVRVTNIRYSRQSALAVSEFAHAWLCRRVRRR